MEEVKAKEETKKPVQTETQPQIVTIKRVMESNSAEPTVTITLKVKHQLKIKFYLHW